MRRDAHRQPVVVLQLLYEDKRDFWVDLVQADHCGAISQPLVHVPRQFDHFAPLPMPGEGGFFDHAHVEACGPERRGIGVVKIRFCHLEHK